MSQVGWSLLAGPRRYMRLTSAIMALVAMILCTACTASNSPGVDPTADYQCEDCNVILISIDTLSAPHLGSYGYYRNTSPNIDRFAEEAVLFERVMNNGGGTLASHMTMLTSLYPETHEMIPTGPAKEEVRRLSDVRITLAEQLKDEGYVTAGFADSGWMEERFGFGQGFDIYDDEHGHFKVILPKVYDWLSANYESQFFLFIHTYDVHSKAEYTYRSPEGFNDLFYPEYTGEFRDCIGDKCGSRLLVELNKEIEHRNLQVESVLSDEAIRYMVAQYDAGIAYVDHELGKLWERLKELGVYEKSLIILTSDHGEEFLEHGLFLHRQTYEEVAHVPLIVKFPYARFGGRRISGLAATVDIMPTILDVAGIEANPWIQGLNLMPLFFGRSLGRDSVHIFGGGSWSRPKLMTEKWSVVVDKKSGQPIQVFDLEVDNSELNNVFEANPDVAMAFSERLASLEARDRRLYQDFAAAIGGDEDMLVLDEETLKRLKALGYIQ